MIHLLPRQWMVANLLDSCLDFFKKSAPESRLLLFVELNGVGKILFSYWVE